MPAPTAPLKPAAAVTDETNNAAQLPQADEEGDTGFALEGMDTLPTDATSILQPLAVPRAAAADSGADADADMDIDEESKPRFGPVAGGGDSTTTTTTHVQTRKVPIPPHRMTPLKSAWPKIYTPLIEHLKLQVRMNPKQKRVELRTSRHTTDDGAIQKGEDVSKLPCCGGVER